MEKKVKKIIAEIAQEPEIKDSDRLIHDLGMDSLDCIDLVCELEDEFGINIPDEDAEEWETVKQVVEYVEGKAKAGYIEEVLKRTGEK